MTKEALKEKIFTLLKRRSKVSAMLLQLEFQTKDWHVASTFKRDTLKPLKEEIEWLSKEIEYLSQLLETY